MFNQLHLYDKFLFSKEVCMILTLITSLFIVATLYSGQVFEGYQTMELYLLEYQEMFLLDYLLITKVISVILSVLLVIVMYSEQGLNLRLFVIDSFTSKYKFFLSRLVFSFLITIILSLLTVSIFVIIYQQFTPYNYDFQTVIQLFVTLMIQNLFYVYLCHALISIVPSVIIGFIPIVIFWYYEINFLTMVESNSSLLLFSTNLVPHISLIQGKIELYSHVMGYMIFILIFIEIYLFVNINKDIN